jgi:phage gp46-like protein
MADIKLRFDPDLLEGDFLFSNNDLEMDDGIGTAVLISLFTDRRANDDDELPDEQGSKRGWVGDLIDPVVTGDQIGSRLWLLERSKITQETLNLAEEYAQEALEWLIDDGVAQTVTVTAEEQRLIDGDRLNLTVEIFKSDGDNVVFNFDDLWGVSVAEGYS